MAAAVSDEASSLAAIAPARSRSCAGRPASAPAAPGSAAAFGRPSGRRAAAATGPASRGAVHGIAGGELLRLRPLHLDVARDELPEGRAAGGDLREAGGAHDPERPADLGYGPGEGLALAETAVQADRTFAPDGRRFDGAAVFGDDEERNDTAVRKIVSSMVAPGSNSTAPCSSGTCFNSHSRDARDLAGMAASRRLSGWPLAFVVSRTTSWPAERAMARAGASRDGCSVSGSFPENRQVRSTTGRARSQYRENKSSRC